MPAAALRASRAAATRALLEPAPFAMSLPLRGLPEARVARAILRAVGGSLRAERGRTTVVEPAGDGSRPSEWSLATTGDSRVRLTTPLLEGAAGLACLQAVVRALRAEGACGDGGLCVHLDAADLTARGLETLVALVARQLPVVYVAAGVEPPASPPLVPGVLRRLESWRTRLARQKDAARWAGTDGAGRAALGIDLDRLAKTGFVGLGLPLVSLHSAEVAALVQIAAGLLHRARTARAVVRSARPVRANALKYDLRVLLLYLGFIGNEFRAQREQLLHRVPGSAAWKVPPHVDPRAAAS